MQVTLAAWRDAFLFTQAVEIPIYVFAMRHAVAKGIAERPRSWGIQILAAFGASAITHPVVWFVIPRLAASFADPGHAYLEYVIRAETFAVVVEAFYFYSLGVVRMRRALVWSIVANGLSAGAGFASRHLFGWP